MRKSKHTYYDVTFTENTHVHISNGNDKLGNGIYNISTLSGGDILRYANGQPVCNVAGTCGGCCSDCDHDCYAKAYTVYHSNVCVRTYADNTLLQRYDLPRYQDEIQQFIDRNVVGVFRWHVSGEIASKEYLEMMFKLATDNPRVQFYVYTKRISWVNDYIAANGLRDNLTIIFSKWNSEINNPHKLPVFVLDDGTDPCVATLPHCPAVNRNGGKTGMTCAACKRCIYAKSGDVIAVYKH